MTALLVLAATPVQMGLLTALGAAPVVLLGLLAGVWVDRLRRKPILIATDLARALILASIPLAALGGWLRIEQLYLVAALVGGLTLFFTVAKQAYVPALVSRERLVEANSKLGASEAASEIGGAALAGGLVQGVGGPLAIALDALSFLVSALFVGAIRRPEPRPPGPTERASLWQEIGEGLRVLIGQPTLRVLVGSTGVWIFFGNFFATLYSFYAIRELGLAPVVLGLIIALGGVSALAGAVLTERITRRVGLGKAIGGGLLISSAVQLLVPLAGGAPVVAVGLLVLAQLLGDGLLAVYFTAELSLRQAITPDHLLGRTNASLQVLIGGVAPLGTLAAGALGEWIGPRLTLLIAVGGMVGAALWLLGSPVRGVKSGGGPSVTTPSAG